MKILVTGAKGFVGKNLCATLKNIAGGKDRSYALTPELKLLEADRNTDPAVLSAWCAECDFVVHLAGVNRPKEPSAFLTGNLDFTAALLDKLERAHNTCPVLFSSSIQAELDNPYGQSKLAAERLLRKYGDRTGASVLIYRLPNLFGKWCRPNYNSVVATYCHNLARGLPIQINHPETQLRLVYIDDAVSEMIAALQGEAHCDGEFCVVEPEYRITLGALAELLKKLCDTRTQLGIPKLDDPLTAKLWATFLSYLPEDGFSCALTTHADARGSFTEIFRTTDRGQFSVNISKPGAVKGNHWHHSKNEKFLVVSGRGVIRFRRLDSERILEYFVSGEKLEVVDIPAGYTHNIENLGETDMVTFMWASECFDPEKPDTFFLEV